MNRPTFKKTAIVVAIVLTSSIGSAINVSAASKATSSATSNAPAQNETQTTKRKLFEEILQKIEHEALEAVTGTQNALLALQKNDTKKALALLQDVSGKLDILLAKNPGMTLIPANVEADVYDFDSTSEQVEKMVDQADELLDGHQVQDARKILTELVSEIRITTTSLPLGTFPVAIKDAVRLIDEGKTNEAAEALYEVLNLVVKTTETIPLPVLRAEALLTAASELEHRTDLSKEASRTEVIKLTDAAKEKLKLAEMLGYCDKDDYKQLYKSIDEIKDVLHSEKSTATWDRIKNSVSAFKNKIIHPKK